MTHIETLETNKSDSKKIKTQKNKPSPLLSLVKYSSIGAILTTYSHFFGFSFLKGKLEGAGFPFSNIDPNVNETLHQAAAATAISLNALVKAITKGELLKLGISYGALSTISVLLILILIFLNERFLMKYNISGSDIVKMKSWPNWIKIISLVGISGISGFLLPYIAIILLFVAIAFGWLGLTFGEQLGQNQINKAIADEICHQLDWSSYKRDVAMGCTTITLSDGSELHGASLFEDLNQQYFITNYGSYRLDNHLNILSYNCFHVRPKKGQAKNINKTCLASCSPECQTASIEPVPAPPSSESK